jgi:hypothetical protein
MSRSTHKRGISGETSTVVATLLMFNLIGIESTTVRLEEEDWHEDTLGTRVYQISMPEYHRENVRLMDLGPGGSRSMPEGTEHLWAASESFSGKSPEEAEFPSCQRLQYSCA